MRKAPILVILMLALGCANLAKADQLFVTPTGSTDTTGDSVSASVDFSLGSCSAGSCSLTITPTDTQSGVTNAGQLLTDVFFTLSAGTPTSLASQTGDEITIASGGGSTNDGSSTLGWGFGAATIAGHSGYEICVICQGSVTGSATPSEGIIGPSPNGNGSIDGNGPHNPFVNGTATFTLTGIPVGTTISNVSFSFGTTAGDNVGAVSPVPEPASMTLFGIGLLALGAKLRRRPKT